jgi:hypothetical protein
MAEVWGFCLCRTGSRGLGCPRDRFCVGERRKGAVASEKRGVVILMSERQEGD